MVVFDRLALPSAPPGSVDQRRRVTAHPCALEREKERALLRGTDRRRHDDVHGYERIRTPGSRVRRMDDRLRRLWDFDDLDGSERRLRTQLDKETSVDGRAEVLTQLARVAGLRGDFGAADELLDEAGGLADEHGLARIRITRSVSMSRSTRPWPRNGPNWPAWN